ncbi:hypothetical protein ACNOYE_31015 [Nannocystaceae bacterium ST9]
MGLQRDLGVGSCARCGALLDLRSQLEGMPAELALPRGIRVKRGERTLELIRVTRRAWHALPVATTLAAAGLIAWTWYRQFSLAPNPRLAFSTLLLLGSLALLGYVVALLWVLAERVRVRVDANALSVQGRGRPPRTIARDEIVQIYATEGGAASQSGFCVMAQRREGEPVLVLEDIADARHALFIEQEIERALGLANHAVAGELGRATPPERLPAAKLSVLALGSVGGPLGVALLTMVSVRACGVTLGEVPLGSDASEGTIAIELREPSTELWLWADVELRGAWVVTSDSETRGPEDLPKLLAVEVELVRAGKVEQRLRCDPFDLDWIGVDASTSSSWSFDGPMTGCSLRVLGPGPVELHLRRVDLAGEPSIVISEFSVAAKL